MKMAKLLPRLASKTPPPTFLIGATLAANLLMAVLLLAFVGYLWRRHQRQIESFYQHADASTTMTCTGGSDFVFEMDGFLSPAQCDALMKAAADKGMRRSQVGEQSSSIDTDIRKSTQAWFKPEENDVAQFIREKVQRLVSRDARVSRCFGQGGIKDYYFEDIQVVRYGVKGKYDPHFDATECGEDIGVACAPNQRVATVLIYLNDNFEGGHTRFPKLGLDVVPKKGKAIFFWVSDASGESSHVYAETLHGGDPVDSGEKFIATQWIRYGTRPSVA